MPVSAGRFTVNVGGAVGGLEALLVEGVAEAGQVRARGGAQVFDRLRRSSQAPRRRAALEIEPCERSWVALGGRCRVSLGRELLSVFRVGKLLLVENCRDVANGPWRRDE